MADNKRQWGYIMYLWKWNCYLEVKFLLFLLLILKYCIYLNPILLVKENNENYSSEYQNFFLNNYKFDFLFFCVSFGLLVFEEIGFVTCHCDIDVHWRFNFTVFIVNGIVNFWSLKVWNLKMPTFTIIWIFAEQQWTMENFIFILMCFNSKF